MSPAHFQASRPDVNEGSYILSVLSHDFTFDSVRTKCSCSSNTPDEPIPQLRVDVPTKDAKPDIRPYVPGTPHNPPSSILLPYPITLAPRNKNVYFVERETFNVLGMLRNPMVLMMVGMGVLLLGMPYIMVSYRCVSLSRDLSQRIIEKPRSRTCD